MPPDASPRSTAATPPTVANADRRILVRPLVTGAELKACVALQDEVWGAPCGESVPASLLHVVPRVGGIVAGAFAADELVGFVFGVSGPMHGRLVHWSHALGVRESARNAGVGRMLKLYQRAELARLGITSMYWTFDPLMAKNAHFNLNRLGARVVEYAEDMYGTTGSPLHHGLPTDRLVVAWSTTAEGEPSAPAARPIVAGADRPILTIEPQPGDALADFDRGALPAALLIEIPADLQRLPPARAAAWHTSVRSNFQRALQAGYAVTGLYRDAPDARSFYVLELHVNPPP